jgi:hypothetical protein
MEGSVLEILVSVVAVTGIIAAIPTIEHYTRRTARAIRQSRHRQL